MLPDALNALLNDFSTESEILALLCGFSLLVWCFLDTSTSLQLYFPALGEQGISFFQLLSVFVLDFSYQFPHCSFAGTKQSS